MNTVDLGLRLTQGNLLKKIKTYIYTQLWIDPFDRKKTNRGINRDERIQKENVLVSITDAITGIKMLTNRGETDHYSSQKYEHTYQRIS